MELLIVLVAALGVLAVLVLLSRAAFRVLSGTVESFVAREVGQTRARHGDVTGVGEAEAVRSAARRRRGRAIAEIVGLAALLIFGALSPWTAPFYAALAVLWIPMLMRIRRPAR